MKRAILLVYLHLVMIGLSVNLSFADSLDQKSQKVSKKTSIRSIWKFEQDYSKYDVEDGIAKKVYYLCLNNDGTYNQYVMVISDPSYKFKKHSNYSLDGKWEEKNGKLILEENGKKNAIDYSFFVTNFENIDNQIIYTK